MPGDGKGDARKGVLLLFGGDKGGRKRGKGKKQQGKKTRRAKAAERRGLPSQRKAGKILTDKEVRGEPLTDAQRGLFGLISRGGTPTKTKRR